MIEDDTQNKVGCVMKAGRKKRETGTSGPFMGRKEPVSVEVIFEMADTDPKEQEQVRALFWHLVEPNLSNT
jgi:hypothetical protein